MQEEQNSCPSLTKDGQFTSLGPWALQSCPLLLGGPLGRTVQDGKKSPRPQAYLRVCVSCVSSIYSRVCSSVSCVPIKPDNYYYYYISLLGFLRQEETYCYCRYSYYYSCAIGVNGSH